MCQANGGRARTTYMMQKEKAMKFVLLFPEFSRDFYVTFPCSFDWWLVADADLF
jgi:hypothetical protein